MLFSFFVEAAHLSSNKMARRERRERGLGGATGTGLLGLATHHNVISIQGNYKDRSQI